MTSPKKPPPPVPKGKPKPPEEELEIVEMSLDEIAEKPTTLMGVPLIPEVEAKTTEAKPTETPKEEPKPVVEAKAEEVKPAETKPAETKPFEAKKKIDLSPTARPFSARKSMEPKPLPKPESKPPVTAAESKAPDKPADEAKPADAKASDAKPAEAAPLKTLLGVPALDPTAKASPSTPPTKDSTAEAAPSSDAPSSDAPSSDAPSSDAPSSEAPPSSDAPSSTDGLPPPTEPILVKNEDEDRPQSVPPPAKGGLPEPIRAILEGPKPRLYAFAGAAGLIVLVFFGVIIRALTSSSDGSTTTTAATSSVTASATAAPTDSAPPIVASASATPPPPAKPPVCTVSGEAKTIAARAVVSSGIEIVARDGAIALGFARGPREAVALELDPATLAVTATHEEHAPDTIKRVTPLAPGKLAIDVDARSDKLAGRRWVAGWDVGVASAVLVWAPHGTAQSKPLWHVPSSAPVEALRGVTTSDGIALAYRHDGAIWSGLAKADGASLTAAPASPVHVAGLGGQLGSPAIAASGGNVAVAWADHANAEAPWELRSFVWHDGADAQAAAFQPPAGGPGGNVMSPSLTALDGGAFLLLWTEGPMGQQVVRAQVLSSAGAATGGAVEVSGSGVHAGQGRAAVLADGRGLVAYLASAGANFEIRAIALTCKAP